MTENQNQIKGLRKEAERLLGSVQKPKPEQIGDTLELIHELRVHQMALSLQSENLRGTQQSLEKSNRLYLSLFNLSPMGILRLDQEFMVLEANKTALEQLGPEDLVKGQSFMSLVDEAHQASCRTHFDSAAYYERCTQCEVVLNLGSGGRQNARLHTTALSLGRSGQEGYLTVLVDTTGQQKDRADLESAASKLEEVNTTLKVILQDRDEEIGKVKESIAINTARFIMPLLGELAKSGLSQEQEVILQALRANLDKITSGMALKLTSAAYGLSHRELEVANLIRDGLTSDEVSEVLNISRSCVLFHRNKIRSKLGLVGKKKRLAEHLAQLE